MAGRSKWNMSAKIKYVSYRDRIFGEITLSILSAVQKPAGTRATGTFSQNENTDNRQGPLFLIENDS